MLVKSKPGTKDMAAERSRKVTQRYKKYLKTVDPTICEFCSISQGHPQLLKQTAHFKVLRNRFPYSLWDSQTVTDHLILTPIRHTNTLLDMSPEEKLEYIAIIEKYEAQGYNVYARARGSAMKSIVHQHTHFIKTAGSPRRFVFFLRKPYYRFTR